MTLDRIMTDSAGYAVYIVNNICQYALGIEPDTRIKIPRKAIIISRDYIKDSFPDSEFNIPHNAFYVKKDGFILKALVYHKERKIHYTAAVDLVTLGVSCQIAKENNSNDLSYENINDIYTRLKNVFLKSNNPHVLTQP